MNVAHWTDADELKSTSIHMLATSPSMLRQFVMHTCHGPRSLKQTNPSPYRNDTKLSKLKCGIRLHLENNTSRSNAPRQATSSRGRGEEFSTVDQLNPHADDARHWNTVYYYTPCAHADESPSSEPRLLLHRQSFLHHFPPNFRPIKNQKAMASLPTYRHVFPTNRIGYLTHHVPEGGD